MDASPARPSVAALHPRPSPQRRLWGPVTVRCAWELLLAGVSPRGPILRLAREHALSLTPADANLAEAEAIASMATRDLLERERGVYAPWAPDPDLDILPDPRWREAILRYADPVHDAVFRLHFADGLSMDDVSMRTGLDTSVLRAARDGLVALAREVLVEDGLPVHDWEPARLDRLVSRVATAAGDMCPGPGGLATDQGRAHAEGCPRCSRALRLLREGIVSPSDLFPPDDGPLLPEVTTEVLVVQLHPDARKARRALVALLGDQVRVLNREYFLVDLRAVPDVEQRLVSAAEEGNPSASRLRVIRRPLRGRLHGSVVVGPDLLQLLEELHRLEWGATRGMPALPDPLPPPPSAARWWMTAVVTGLLAAAAGTWALLPPRPPADVDLMVERTPDGVRFDTDDDAYVDVLALRGATLALVAHSQAARDKGEWATGDGRFALPVDADRVYVVARSTELEGIDQLVAGFSGATADPDEVRDRLRDRYPGAAVEDVP